VPTYLGVSSAGHRPSPRGRPAPIQPQGDVGKSRESAGRGWPPQPRGSPAGRNASKVAALAGYLGAVRRLPSTSPRPKRPNRDRDATSPRPRRGLCGIATPGSSCSTTSADVSPSFSACSNRSVCSARWTDSSAGVGGPPAGADRRCLAIPKANRQSNCCHATTAQRHAGRTSARRLQGPNPRPAFRPDDGGGRGRQR